MLTVMKTKNVLEPYWVCMKVQDEFLAFNILLLGCLCPVSSHHISGDKLGSLYISIVPEILPIESYSRISEFSTAQSAA